MKNIFKLTALFISNSIGELSRDFLETFPTEQISSEQISEASRLNPGLQSASVAGIYATDVHSLCWWNWKSRRLWSKKYNIKMDLLSGDMALARKGYNRWASISRINGSCRLYTTSQLPRMALFLQDYFLCQYRN